MALRYSFSMGNEADLIESVSVEARAAIVGKAIVMTPWEGRMSNYQMRDGMLIPLTGEASWLRPEGRASHEAEHRAEVRES